MEGPLVQAPLIPGTMSGTLAQRLQGLVHITHSFLVWKRTRGALCTGEGFVPWWAREDAWQRAPATQNANLLITL